LDRKGLELNVEKTKVMKFRKGGGRMTRKTWRWKGIEIEEVKEFDYLRYRVQKNRGQEAHVRERIKKAADETNLGDRKEKIWKRLGKKAIVV